MDKTTHEAFKEEQLNLLLWKKLPLARPCRPEETRQLLGRVVWPQSAKAFFA